MSRVGRVHRGIAEIDSEIKSCRDQTLINEALRSQPVLPPDGMASHVAGGGAGLGVPCIPRAWWNSVEKKTHIY
jgi:hypothetical protein